MTQSEPHRLDAFFTGFSTRVAHLTGSHWALLVAGACVVFALAVTSIEVTNFAISVVTLLMLFVLQNTQNRDAAAMNLKMDEVVRVEPHARDEFRRAEQLSAREIRGLGDDEGASDPGSPAGDMVPRSTTSDDEGDGSEGDESAEDGDLHRHVTS